MGPGSYLTEGAVGCSAALAEAAAQVHLQVVDVVSTQVIGGTVHWTAAAIISGGLVAAPGGAAGLAQAAALPITADRNATAADDAVALGALLVGGARRTESLLAGHDALAPAVAGAGGVFARGALRRVQPATLRDDAAEPDGIAVGAGTVRAIAAAVRALRTAEAASGVIFGEGALARSARAVAAAADRIAGAAAADTVHAETAAALPASRAGRPQWSQGRRVEG